MKNYLSQSLKIIAVALIIGWGVSAVSAWTSPTVNPPASGAVKAPTGDTAKGVSASVNMTDFGQIKMGGFIISGIDKYFVSPISFFKKVLLPDQDTSVYIGGTDTADPSFATQFPGDRSVPLTINMSGRSTTTAIKYVADTNSCAGPTKISTDSSAFQFWNNAKNDTTDVLAKGIRLTGGNPASGKILIAVDDNGRAVWATPRLAGNGIDILFDTSESPVGSCNPVIPVQVLGCTDKTAPNYNPNATKDDGSCTTPKVDLCTNIDGIQETVPNGMVKDTSGNTPGLCTTPKEVYHWDTGAWGACTTSFPVDWVDFTANPSMLTWGAQNQSCTTWIAAQNNYYNKGSQSRNVACKDSSGTTVSDSFCTETKPVPFQSCIIPLQYRSKLSNITDSTTTNNYTDTGYCLYGKLPNPNATDPYANIFADDCKTVKMTDPAPAGYNPVSSCGKLVGSGGSCASFGFNASSGGGSCNIQIGSLNMSLQVKKQ